ncbi:MULTISPECIES: hypothetical protein [Methylobacterium]|jgi:uncharacterized protein YjiS (DUF1127 family)|uniref:DUF1127 domain-containing protein n=1 Tax=Methylobacterium longum TaxID=767694 RepID=A0ABT8ARD8_9HYPH|nr:MULTISPECIES: hypothetical protein [Methylobacterium]MCJ2097878.1 hypothetical protein [Methylobacterium sp. E-046]MDN3572155.1 hypothetical protein [Methylobacterium longum]GJE12938.1 hypothetical protein FOHLNKBM_3994 [Methylobacterium longum]
MANRVVASVKSWLAGARTSRDLCRLDCRCLEDIGLDPRDVTAGINRTRHHPSWDDDARRQVWIGPRGEY